MYNYFIKTSDKKVHKFPKPMNWMDSETFAEFLREVKSKNPKALYKESWRSKNAKKQRHNKRAKSSS